MSWCWLALAREAPRDAVATATARDLRGRPVGAFVAWPRHERRRAGAVRVDERVVGEKGPPVAVSFVLAPRGVRVLFDDPAVVGAIKRSLEGPHRTFVSTLTTDAVHFAGAVTGIETPWPGWWSADPFAWVFPAQRLMVDPGIFRASPAPTGPGHQRYGPTPWPVDAFR